MTPMFDLRGTSPEKATAAVIKMYSLWSALFVVFTAVRMRLARQARRKRERAHNIADIQLCAAAAAGESAPTEH